VWDSTIAIYDADATLPINAPLNAFMVNLPLSGLGTSATVVPSAFTMQLMNPEALQTTSGSIYLGTLPVQTFLGGRTDSWATAFDQFIEFQNPRMCSAGKLALRGVQVSSYPMNMSQVSNFTEYVSENDQGFTYGAGFKEVTGWSPIFVRNPMSVDLEFLVTVELRVRFDFSHPASSSHRHYPIASDTVWDRLMSAATALGNGVIDISDTVANVGSIMERASRTARVGAPALALA
jgi:hypothetical protein